MEQSTILEVIEEKIKDKKKELKEVENKIDYIDRQNDRLLAARSFLREREEGTSVEEEEPNLGTSEMKKLEARRKELLAEIKELEKERTTVEMSAPQPF